MPTRDNAQPVRIPIVSKDKLAKAALVNWPKEVRCEMNIPEWEAALRKAGLDQTFADVLHGFKAGFHQGIPDHTIAGMSHYTPPNHSSALQAKDKIEKLIQKELAAGLMFGPFTHLEVASKFPFFRTNPLGAVVNGDGSTRPINDLSFPRNNLCIPLVNSFVEAKDFEMTWDDFNIVACFFQNNKTSFHLAVLTGKRRIAKSQRPCRNGPT
ncbi:hypothetical protein PTTG_04715 [Puccinia triticina 1-1 BBBD Race 1]|uniref:Uncharacterized protein n=1 Tax=Puccinia triticina (isolate 1-1 / race 1 (BBBD)) TaxID=630390 RepID=A0A180GF88_PUCT1|nr:hypothetical protein PTTG_04715 [Puccinia triticina 1-1 BBBD Race 1]